MKHEWAAPRFVAGYAVLLAVIVALASVKGTNGTLGAAFLLAMGVVTVVPVFLYFKTGLTKPLILVWGLSLPTYVRVLLDDPGSHLGGAEVAPIISARLLLVLMLIWSAVFGTRKPSGVRSRLPDALGIGLFAYLAINIASLVYALNSPAAFYEVLRRVQAVAVAWALGRLLSEPDTRKSLVSGVVWGAALQGLLGLVQFLMGGAVGLTSLGEAETNRGLQGFDGGVIGTFWHPGPYALFMAMAASFAVYWAMVQTGIRKLAGYAVFAVILLGVILSASRTAMILIVITVLPGALWAVWTGTRKKATRYWFLALVVLFGVTVAAALGPELVVRFTTNVEASAGPRFVMNGLAIDLLKTRPFLGFGPNNYVDAVQQFFPFLQGDFMYDNPVHNVYLLYLVETGLIGFGAYVAILGATLRRLCLVAVHNPALRLLAISVLASFGTLLVYHMTGWGGIHDQLFFFFWTLIGLAHSIWREHVNGPATVG